MNEHQDLTANVSDASQEGTAVGPGDKSANQGESPEFEITIRKLDIPVRPRGVLAE